MSDMNIPASDTSSTLGGILSGIFSQQELGQIKDLINSSDVGKDKNTQSRFPSIYSKTQADAKIRDIFKKVLVREPTKAELKKWRPALIKAQKENPATQSYSRVGDRIVQSTVGGLDEEEWLTRELATDPQYKDEIKQIEVTPRDIVQRVRDKEAYDKILKRSVQTPESLAQLEQTTTYGLALRGLKNKIQSEADKAGAVYDQADILNWAKEAYDTNQDVDPFSFQKFLDNKFKFSGAGYKGEALNTFIALRDTAIANGLDLDKVFGSQVQDWVKAVNAGSNIEEFKQKIRNVAKIGMPETVSKLVDQGIDLDTIYSPYKKIMASVLELNPASISLDDPTLRSAVGPDKEMTIYDFQRSLRKDPRWQYTNNAREEVSSVALKILQDFGFQG